MEFIIYTDGGCLGNRRDAGCIGGYGFLILNEAMDEIVQGSGKRENVTNNMMEMLAVIEGVKALILEVSEMVGVSLDNVNCVIKTDSRYIIDNYYDYVHIWKKNGWRKKNGSAVLNKKLWIRIDELSREFNTFGLFWVKAHASDPYNNKVDEMATMQMKG